MDKHRSPAQAFFGSSPRPIRSGGAGKLETLSPLKTLGRGGYAICYDQKGQVLVEPGAVEIGARVGVRLHGGDACSAK